ncbi:uncharacterized protein [Rutidosis leptorrhynchoides]|uniref:uncharacterized protein n=1 Tax=Rutidosis leptorrhynchoides TaxID=125765 RepID=UPI003A9A2883
MKILSLNVRGFAVEGKFGWVKNMCVSERPSIAAFQEMKCWVLTDLWIQYLWGNNDFGYVQKVAEGNSRGLLMIWDTTCFEAIEAFGNEFFVAVRGLWKPLGIESVIVNVYGPHGDYGLLKSHETSWLLCGDFNEVRDRSDRINCVFHQKRADRFNQFIRKNNLLEIPISGKKFTRDDLSVIALDRRLSDHCPLLLRDKIIDYGPKPFKVFDTWFDHEGVEEIIKEAWSKPVRGSRKDCNFHDRLKSVKTDLKLWSASTFGKIDGKINHLKKKALEWEIKAESGLLNDEERLEWLECRRRWTEKEKVKSSMLKQKARIRWILEVKAAVFKHFSDLFRNRNISRPILLGRQPFDSPPEHSLTTNEATELEVRFSDAEIWNAVKECGSTKAPGPDDFNLRFYKKFWDIIQEDLIMAINDFWENGEITTGCNASFITLVPKKCDPLCLNDYRPISLLGSYYKIIAKLLANRLRKVVPNLVGFEQSVFIKGRNIIDGALIANEMLAYLKQKKTLKV